MRKFFAWSVPITLAVLAISVVGKVYGGETPVIGHLSDFGLVASILTIVVLCTGLQALIDNGHDTLEALIGRAELKLAARPAGQDVLARTLVADARKLLDAAQEAPVKNVHAGPEMTALREGMLKARQALPLL